MNKNTMTRLDVREGERLQFGANLFVAYLKTKIIELRLGIAVKKSKGNDRMLHIVSTSNEVIVTVKLCSRLEEILMGRVEFAQIRVLLKSAELLERVLALVNLSLDVQM